MSTEIETERPSTSTRVPPRRYGVLALAAVIVLVIDQVSKAVVVATLEHHPPLKLLGGALYFHVIRNSGAAFGIGGNLTWVFSIVMILVSIGVILAASKIRSAGWAIGLGMVLAGALGNLIDRIFRAPGPFRGKVVDFISLFSPNGEHFAIMNFADWGISIGAALIVLLALLGRDYDGRRMRGRGRAERQRTRAENARGDGGE